MRRNQTSGLVTKHSSLSAWKPQAITRSKVTEYAGDIGQVLRPSTNPLIRIGAMERNKRNNHFHFKGIVIKGAYTLYMQTLVTLVTALIVKGFFMTRNIGGKLDYSMIGPPLDVSRSLQVLCREQLSRRPKCELCTRRTSTKRARVVAHILPVEQGGHPSDPDNLWSLCLSCYERLMKTRDEAKMRRRDVVAGGHDNH